MSGPSRASYSPAHGCHLACHFVLQDGFLQRMGGEKTLPVDVRIVAATHRDLSAMVAEGTFREDLWYRIAVFPIVLPPLRERLYDIPDLT